MGDILLSYFNIDSVERMFEEAEKHLPSWELPIAPGKKYIKDTI